MKKIYAVAIALLFITIACAQNNVSHFIFCSDVHFGLTKGTFEGKSDVSSADVNAAMVEQMNKMPDLKMPADNGVAENKPIQNIEAVIIAGDIANREEKEVQSDSISWKEFENDYSNKLKLKKKNGQRSELLLEAGNHDVSNAIGFYKPMHPAVDATSYIDIYNLMMKPKVPLTKTRFDYEKDKIHYSVNMNNVHFQFVNLWPDSAERIWMEKDLQSVSASTPVLIFTHSMPEVEGRFFTNPNDNHAINENDKFENLLSETFKDGNSVKDTALIEQKALATFILKHPNIKAYFHGHSNFTEFYTWTGPDKNIQLPCFRVDSPMKGKVSSKDESKLSFELISIDSDKKLLTVRECLWDTDPTNKNAAVKWGLSKTITLQ